ncbi:MAG: DbpA RNA binding domain-containing protein [Gammaproteobacteria bacterium]
MMAIEDRLRQQMLQVIQSADLESDRVLIRQLATECDVDFLDCAAALIHVYQSSFNKTAGQRDQEKRPEQPAEALFPTPPKMVRYRLEVGRKHSISKEEIKDALVQESGVERKMIGAIDMHHHYTLIELPEGMPSDIFHHLKTVEIKQHRLHIKRTGNSHNKRRNSTIRRGRHRTSQANKPANTVDVSK